MRIDEPLSILSRRGVLSRLADCLHRRRDRRCMEVAPMTATAFFVLGYAAALLSMALIVTALKIDASDEEDS